MASLISAILAFVCFVLALLGLQINVDLVTLGLAFLALAMVFGYIPANSRFVANR